MAGMTDSAGSMTASPLTAFAIVARPPLLPTGAVGGRSRMAGPDSLPRWSLTPTATPPG